MRTSCWKAICACKDWLCWIAARVAAVGPHQVIAVVRTKTVADWLQRVAAREVSEVVFGPRERALPYKLPCTRALREPSANQRPEYSTATPPTQTRDVASTVALLSPSLAAAAPPLPLRDPATQSFSPKPEAVHQLTANNRLPGAGTERRAMHHLVFSISCRAHLHPSFTRPIDDSIRHMVHASDSVEPPALMERPRPIVDEGHQHSPHAAAMPFTYLEHIVQLAGRPVPGRLEVDEFVRVVKRARAVLSHSIRFVSCPMGSAIRLRAKRCRAVGGPCTNHSLRAGIGPSSIPAARVQQKGGNELPACCRDSAVGIRQSDECPGHLLPGRTHNQRGIIAAPARRAAAHIARRKDAAGARAGAAVELPVEPAGEPITRRRFEATVKSLIEQESLTEAHVMCSSPLRGARIDELGRVLGGARARRLEALDTMPMHLVSGSRHLVAIKAALETSVACPGSLEQRSVSSPAQQRVGAWADIILKMDEG